MDQAFAGAWWEDVEHLQEAAERRSQERARAKREGREPVALTPLRPLRDAERAADPHPTGRFRRQSPGAPRPSSPPAARAVAREAVSGYGAATATAAVLAPAPEPELEPSVDDELARLAAPADAPVTPTAPERPSRRDELARLAREQAQAAAQARPRAAGTGVEGRRTIEIRGRVVGPPPALAVVADPVDAPSGSRRRAGRRPAERFAARPDRVALWAFLLGMFLILVAALSAHGA